MMANKNLVSPSMSFQNWSAKEWFKGNWSTIKEGLKVGLPLIISMNLVGPIWGEFLGTVVGKFILDAGEFYFKQLNL